MLVHISSRRFSVHILYSQQHLFLFRRLQQANILLIFSLEMAKNTCAPLTYRFFRAVFFLTDIRAAWFLPAHYSGLPEEEIQCLLSFVNNRLFMLLKFNFASLYFFHEHFADHSNYGSDMN